MTLEIISPTTLYTFNINVDVATLPVPVPGSTFIIEVKSQLSNDLMFNRPMNFIQGNERYCSFEFLLPSVEGLEHKNSMCDYTVFQDGIVIDTGSLKLIYSPGGGTGTQAYISDNEDREGVVYYRPAY